jgi:Flp pilus assembly pilin Flp
MILSLFPLPRLHSEQAQAVSEYALIIALIATLCLAAVGLMGTAIVQTFTTVASALSSGL